MERRTFIRSIAGAAAGAGLLSSMTVPSPAEPAAPWPGPPQDPNDERFWKFVRSQFPLSTERIYLNTGGLGASPYPVIQAVQSKMNELEGMSETGHTEQLWKEIKNVMARLLGCDEGEIALVRNTTEGINIVANGLPIEKGDEIILSTQEHVANALTWLALARRVGAQLRLFEPSTISQKENLDRIERLITRNTRVISIPHAVTTTGLILPVREIAELARAKKIWYFVDGAQTPGMFRFSLHEMGCDAFAASGHKWLMGPKETGLLYVRKEMLDTIQAKHIGAYSDGGYDFLKGTMELNPTAQRYEYGTVSVPLRVGLKAAFEFIDRIGIDTIWKRDQALSTRLFNGLRDIPHVKVLSPADDSMRSAMITFMHETIPHLKLQEHLNTFNLRTRSVSEGGLAALRVSPHIYNSFEEVETVLEGVQTARPS
ncbi:MAG: aminotransferase class V-fold PLP-dependent enzyme [Ignavibacteria bacterium]|nr:aminotransferase class V-fold PLP-dependent enzyme [Ignavibacteria bacterium]